MQANVEVTWASECILCLTSSLSHHNPVTLSLSYWGMRRILCMCLQILYEMCARAQIGLARGRCSNTLVFLDHKKAKQQKLQDDFSYTSHTPDQLWTYFDRTICRQPITSDSICLYMRGSKYKKLAALASTIALWSGSWLNSLRGHVVKISSPLSSIESLLTSLNLLI